MINVDKNLKGKQIKVDIGVTTLKVSVLGEVVMEGDLYEKINSDESIWTLESYDGKKVVDINIVKWPKIMHWWDCIIQGHPKIDT